MIDKQNLLDEFYQNVSDFFPSTRSQRTEMYRAFEYKDCHHWSSDQVTYRESKEKAITVINLAAPLIRQISGTECMQDKKLDLIPMQDDFDIEADIMDDALGYAQYVSGYDSEQSLAREDAATCGLGGTVTYLDFTKKGAIAGTPVVERIFPGFMFYDNSSRGSRLNDRARWCGYAEPVNAANLAERVAKKEKDGSASAIHAGAGDYKAELLSFSRQDNMFKIDFVYHYFWWDYDDIYDVANPFIDESGGINELLDLIENDDDVANLIGETAEDINIDWKAQYWSFDSESYSKFKNTLETIRLLTGLDIPPPDFSKREGKCYYRAEIARGMVLNASRSYTQGGHPLNFITGYFDEALGIYYGMMRPLSFIQDALNLTTSDFLSYATKAAHGGASYIKGGAEAIERIKKEKANEDSLTPIPKDAEIIAKALPATPEVLINFIRLMMEVMPRAIGVGEEFLGIINSGDMTDALYGKVIKQSYAVLANFANNSASYSRRQGEIFIDIIRLMAEANDGMVLPILSPGKSGDQYLRLRRQNIARDYAVRIAERPMTADERQDAFNKIGVLVPQLLQYGVNIVPQWLKYAPVDKDDKDAMVQASMPQPQPPNPQNEKLMEANIRMTNAQAARLEMEADEKAKTNPLAAPESQSIIEKNLAQAAKAMSDASKPKPRSTTNDNGR